MGFLTVCFSNRSVATGRYIARMAQRSHKCRIFVGKTRGRQHFEKRQKYGKIRRWADKFCLQCNIFIYIRHIWIKPVLCSRMESLFHHISPWTHTDAYSPNPVHIEMEEFSDVRFKQRAVTEFSTAEKVPPIEIHRRMQAVYGYQCVYVSTIRRWVRWSLQWGKGFKNKTPISFKDGFQKLVQPWRKCIEERGDFVEK